jgi:anti-anti-sigma regulatory factor
MVMKIEKVSDGPNVLLKLSGRIESQEVQELKAQIDGSGQRFVLDLEHVQLVDLDAVHFLAVCEAKGIELRHCPPYVREWIRSERPRISDGMRKTD